MLNSTPVNAGDGEFRGGELELQAYPIERLRLDLAGSYLHFKLTRLGAPGLTIAGITLNNKAPYAPEWKASAGVQYTVPSGRPEPLRPGWTCPINPRSSQPSTMIRAPG